MTEVELHKVTLDAIEMLYTISRQTFIDAFAKQNQAENMEIYLNNNLTIPKLLNEIQNPNSSFYFASKQEEILGYLKVNEFDAQTELQDPNALEIERIYILQAYQGQHVGMLLMTKALELAKAKHKQYVWLGVWEENLKALSFYEKIGFIAFGAHIFQMGSDPQKDILMKLEIA